MRSRSSALCTAACAAMVRAKASLNSAKIALQSARHRTGLLCSTAKLVAERSRWVKLGHCSDVHCTTAPPPKAEVHPRSCFLAQVPTAVSTRSRTAPYSITSSARASDEGGTVSPSILAALRVDDQFKLAGLN